MKKIVPGALCAALLTAAGPAHAASVLVSPIIPSNINTATLEVCQVLNASSKTVEVTLEIVNSDTTAVLSTQSLAVDPGKNLTINASSPSANTFCRATGLSTKSGRLSYVVADGSANILMSVSNP